MQYALCMITTDVGTYGLKKHAHQEYQVQCSSKKKHNKPNRHSQRCSCLSIRQLIWCAQKRNAAPPKIIILAGIIATTETLQ